MFIGDINMLNEIYILGAGGMARETYQIYVDLDKSTNICGFLINKKIAIDKKNLPKPLINANYANLNKHIILINGIGSPLRRNWIKKLEEKGFRFDSVIHSSAILGRNLKLGKDLVVCASTVLTCDIKVGNHVILNANVTVAHDTEIGDFTTISPGVNLGGRVTIGEGTFVGIGTTVIQRIKIGSNVFVGAGSVVTEDIPDNTLVYGNPARIIKNITEDDWGKSLKL